jgi:hypothetical protein
MTSVQKTSWEILGEPNRILVEEDYKGPLELLIFWLTFMVEIGLSFLLAVSYLRG